VPGGQGTGPKAGSICGFGGGIAPGGGITGPVVYSGYQ